jgi:2,4-dienoyl-CoA reductase-like NADH-dependent reductase (Old Yellow Enzyme family)
MHLLNLAISGAGMLFIEGMAVLPEGRITPNDLGLWDDQSEAAFRPVMAAIRKYSNIPVTLQIAHAGRKGSSHLPWNGGAQSPISDGGWETPAPSARPHKAGEMPAAGALGATV